MPPLKKSQAIKSGDLGVNKTHVKIVVVVHIFPAVVHKTVVALLVAGLVLFVHVKDEGLVLLKCAILYGLTSLETVPGSVCV
jgi:hypothetical protein